MAAFDNLEKGKDSFLNFSIAWNEVLANLSKVGIVKDSGELYYTYVRKLGTGLQKRILEDNRFWPPEETDRSLQEYRHPKTWQEAALVAKEVTSMT